MPRSHEVWPTLCVCVCAKNGLLSALGLALGVLFVLNGEID